jgi:hypothetical protein
MATDNNTAPAEALIKDALQRLGKARLSLDLTRDLLEMGGKELAAAADNLAAAARLAGGAA